MKKGQKSSIEWLIDKWNEYPIEIGKAQFRRYLYEAKELHKKEIIEAYISASANLEDITREAAEQYYNEKYGGMDNCK